jgi:hypothetical protein
LLVLVTIGLPHAAPAAVGDALPGTPITPTAATTVDPGLGVVDPTCDSQGGTSMAIVQGSKLAGVDPVQYPVLLAISCLDNGGGATAVARRNRLNFLDPATGNVVKSISTTNAPSNGWAHWVNRPDKGNLLACGNDGTIYSIVYSQFDTSLKVANPATAPTLTAITGSLSKNPTYFVKYTYLTAEGETLPSPEVSKKFTGGGTTGIRVTAPPLPLNATGIAVYISTSAGTETKQGVSPLNSNVFDQTSALVAGAAPPSANTTGNTTGTPGSKTLLTTPVAASCVGLAWDADEDMIYRAVTGGTNSVGIERFKEGTTAAPQTFNTTCTASGLAITGGVLLVACDGKSTILRLDKTAGATLSPHGTLGILGLPADSNLNPDLGDFACDPVTFQTQLKDAMWSRNGLNGNAAVALKFPPFTCGLPSSAKTLWAGLSAPASLVPGGPLVAGVIPRSGCLNNTTTDPNDPTNFDGDVIDSDGDGLPDCWETNDIDFDGDGTVDLELCVPVDTNGDGIPETTPECADPSRKDVFVEIDWMQDHKPDPQSLSQTQSVASVGVTSIRESFAAAPVCNPVNTPGCVPKTGIAIHFQVDGQVTFTALDGTAGKTHVSQVVFTPCTGPASFAGSQSDAADFDAIKKANFGTASERSDANHDNILNAKRLAFHYVLFAHKQVGSSPGAGTSASGCSEVGGDDLAVTLGGFTTTIVGGVSHARGTKDEQAGTLMHEIGHNLGLRHGGHDNVNGKPNYLSVMSYTRQFSTTIPNRRLDYSRAQLDDLNEAGLNEGLGLGSDPSLGAIPDFLDPITHLPTPDQTAVGGTAPGQTSASWTVVPANASSIDWNKNGTPGENPSVADINSGPASDGLGSILGGHNDWNNLTYRFSAALDFAGGVHTATTQEHVSITKEQEDALFLAADLDGNGKGDAEDCGTFTCTHRIDVKPADPTNMITLGQEATISIAIYSEINGTSVGTPAWDASALVVKDVTLKMTGGGGTVSVVVNQNGQGTCSARDVSPKDGVKDLLCQFSSNPALVLGTQSVIVTGFFIDPVTGNFTGFRGRQDVTVIP